MDFKNVLVDSSAQLIKIVANQIDCDEILFNDLLIFCFEEHKQYSNRASRVVEKISLNHPTLFIKNIDKIIDKIPHLKDKSVERNFLQAIYNNITIIKNENHFGKIANICFPNINNYKLPIALRYYSIKIVFEITKIYPELIPELIEMLELVSFEKSVGIKNYSKKLLEILYKKV
jgi:hypothetical protein